MRKAIHGDGPVAPFSASHSETDLRRRRFLFTLGATGATAAVAAKASAVGDVLPSTETQIKNDESGYRETAHVSAYYRTAKI